MLHHVLAFVLVLVMPAVAFAQPFNVRSWYADGQVFVVWQFPAPPAIPTDTVEIYASGVPQPDVALMTRVGRLFYPEYTGARLDALLGGARLLVPTPGGGTYRLATDEGVFAFTPHAAGNLFFAVVDTGSTAVVAGNSDTTAFAYDPANEPVHPHPQFSGFTPGGFPYVAFVLWADGRDDPQDARPDVPVLANAAKNGVPHVFTVTHPLGGLPAGDLACVVALHGGGGEYQLFRPGIPARANVTLPLTDGIVVTPDDSFYSRIEAVLERSNTSWFGYTPTVDPFDSLPRVAPPDDAVVINYTQRRVFWILDTLMRANSPYSLDPRRVAMIGHSGGGRGTSHLTRTAPERFCAAVCYTPALNLDMEGLTGGPNFLRGTNGQNLATNLPRPGGKPGEMLGVTDIFTATTRVSLTQRDFPLTRIYLGKRDTESSATWNAGMRAVIDSIDAAGQGYLIFWDEREHGVEMWHTEDATPGPDIGQWIAPARSTRPACQTLVDAYRTDESYPGFYNADQDPATIQREGDPGPGNPNLGDVYGTWGGYFDWETASIVDTALSWECTIFVTALSGVSIDNAPAAVTEISTDLAPRKTNAFNPIGGRPIAWDAVDVASGAVVQSGTSTTEDDGVVRVTGLLVPRDPDRVRLVVRVDCPTDIDANTVSNSADVSQFINLWFVDQATGTIVADWNGDGLSNSTDVSAFINSWFEDQIRGCA